MAKDEDTAETVIGCILITIMLPITILLRGFVLTRLWFWFLVPLGLTPIGLWHANGLSVLIALFTGIDSSDKSDKDKGMATLAGTVIAKGIFAPLLFWGIGWICYQAM